METANPPDAVAVLRCARRQVRSRTRSASYYAAADHFSEMFLGRPFHLEPGYYRAVGTDYSVIDWFYEELGSGGEEALETLATVTQRLQEMAEPVSAAAALEPLHEALEEPGCDVLDVCRALQGAITVLGHEALRGWSSPGLADAWLRLWQDVLWRQNSQQARLNQLSRVLRAPPEDQPRLMSALGLSPDDMSLQATDFTQGLHAYLEKYSETGAASVALVGGLPFSRALSREGLEELLQLLTEEPAFLARLSRLLRLAQDVRFDPSEPLNTGVAGYAAEHHLRLVDVDARRLPQEELDSRLKAEWHAYQAESRGYFEAQVAWREDETLQGSLRTFVDNLHALASRLARQGHEADPLKRAG